LIISNGKLKTLGFLKKFIGSIHKFLKQGEKPPKDSFCLFLPVGFYEPFSYCWDLMPKKRKKELKVPKLSKKAQLKLKRNRDKILVKERLLETTLPTKGLKWEFSETKNTFYIVQDYSLCNRCYHNCQGLFSFADKEIRESSNGVPCIPSIQRRWKHAVRGHLCQACQFFVDTPIRRNFSVKGTKYFYQVLKENWEKKEFQ